MGIQTRNFVVAVSVLGLVLPPATAKAEHAKPTSVPSVRSRSDLGQSPDSLYRILDVVLTSDARACRGQIVDRDGLGLPGVSVALFQSQRHISSVSTGSDGTFSISGLRGGVYQIVAGDNLHVVRLWSPNAAPPSAQRRVVFVTDPLMRGQMHPAASMLGNPWVITGLVAAAVIIPVALHNNRSDRRSGS